MNGHHVYDSLSANRAVCGPPAKWDTKTATLEALEDSHPAVWQDWFDTDGRDRPALVNWINAARKRLTKST